MNEVRLSGTLTKAPYFADKGWAAATLAVKKEGTTFSLWVPLFFSSKTAANLKGLALTDVLEITGELDQTKDKKMQVKVSTVAIKKGAAPVARKWDAGTEITDSDIPF